LKELQELEKYGAKYITYKDSTYPEILRQIHDPPPFLSYIGNIDLLSRDICAIVGSRNASFHGQRFAGIIAKDLAANGIVIASGLANGIDSAAHSESISSTIAVIGGGIDQIYPAFNHKLYKDIAAKGLIIAENRIGSAPTPHCFPKRNRIIAGISKVTLVVEATLKSGSLITARCAMEMGREVAAVPGYPLDSRSRGTNSLIKDGAHMIESADDILEIMNIGKTPQEEIKKPQEKEAAKAPISSNKQRILSLLSAEPISINEICAETNLTIPAVCEVLIEEEIEGNIVRVEGNKFALDY
jgi:DNA processing protein